MKDEAFAERMKKLDALFKLKKQLRAAGLDESDIEEIVSQIK